MAEDKRRKSEVYKKRPFMDAFFYFYTICMSYKNIKFATLN